MSDPDTTPDPSPDGTDVGEGHDTPDPDAPGSFVDDDDSLEIPEPNEPG